MTNATLKTVGVKLDPNFPENGRFEVQMLVEEPSLEQKEGFLLETKNSVESLSCETGTTGVSCDCIEVKVTPAATSALDIAIDIDSSGSNVSAGIVGSDNLAPSDPLNQRLAAASSVIDVLLNDQNRIALFDFGTRYCVSPVAQSCPESNPDSPFYRTLPMIGPSTYRFADYTDPSGKETLKTLAKKAIWQRNNGTPLYDSLIEVMNDMSDLGRESAKMIILFSDGEPLMNMATEADVCQKAQSMAVKIQAIGYGMASIHHEMRENGAITVLQNLATCSGGGYFAIEDVGVISEKTAEMGKGIVLGTLDQVCEIPTGKIDNLANANLKVEGKVKLKFQGADWKEAPFSLLPPRKRPFLGLKLRKSTATEGSEQP
jgi:hypothetical protein